MTSPQHERVPVHPLTPLSLCQSPHTCQLDKICDAHTAPVLRSRSSRHTNDVVALTRTRHTCNASAPNTSTSDANACKTSRHILMVALQMRCTSKGACSGAKDNGELLGQAIFATAGQVPCYYRLDARSRDARSSTRVIRSLHFLFQCRLPRFWNIALPLCH